MHGQIYRKIKDIFQIFCIFFFSLMFSLLIIKFHYFEAVDLEQIIFHLYAPLKGSPTDLWRFSFPVLAIFFFVFIFLLFLKKKATKVFFYTFTALIWVDISFLEINLGAITYILNQFSKSKFIEQNYVNPKNVHLTFPKHKKNLIFILAESMETTFQDTSKGGVCLKNYLPRLSSLADTHLHFSHTDKQEGAEVFSNSGWTIAAMVTQMAGVPLKTYGNSFADGGNRMDAVASFLPGAWTLGDILFQNGYSNVFIAGSDTEFAGKKLFMSQHGNYEIYDKPKMEEQLHKKFNIVHDRIMADSELFSVARDKITKLSQEARPFHVLLLTGNTHLLGYVENDCIDSSGEEPQIGKVYTCADRYLNDFVTWIMSQPFYQDTVVVIIGDHCNTLSFDAILNNTIEYSLYAGEMRKVYNVFINTDTVAFQTSNRKFSTLDMYPTILASLGVKIEGNQLGLGTNLFSDKPTLLEQYSYDYINREFKKKSDFYMKKLWKN